MYFVHAADNGNLILDLSGIISFSSSFSLGRSSLRIGTGDISITEDKNIIPSSFICQTCHKTVEVSQIRGRCGNCGKVHPLDTLFKLDGSSGIFCPICMKEMEGVGFEVGSKFTKVSSIFSKVSLRR